MKKISLVVVGKGKPPMDYRTKLSISESISRILFGMRLWTLMTIKCSITLIGIHYKLVDPGKQPPSIVLSIMLLEIVDCAVIVQ